jgi:protein-S-isoprenylcysteine O-methyltransferase Ste14
MYLGMLLLLLAWAVFLSHPLALAIAAAFVPLMNRLQIAPEERILSGLFPAEFRAYQSRVRRWI